MKRNQPSIGKKLLFAGAGILMLVASFFLIAEDVRLLKKSREVSKKVDSYSKEIAKLETSNENLKNKIENYDDIDYVEKIAREEENLKKPGENAVSFVVPDNKEVMNAQVDASVNGNVFQRVFNQVVNYLKEIF